MSTRYPGGFINRSAPVIVGPTNGEGGSAPGVWTLEQASYYTKQGTWPQRIKNKPLYAWGYNADGGLGLNDIISRSSPVQVGSQTDWVAIATGSTQTYATKTNGTLWSWGSNTYGQIGDNTTVSRSSPVQVGALSTWLVVSGGFYSGFAVKTDGTLWSWGSNNQGQLGDGTRTRRSSPVQIGTLANWSIVRSGRLISINSTIALKTDKTLWAWGPNSLGTLGQNDTIYRSSPVQIGLLSTWLTCDTTGYTSGAINQNGTLWTWGYNGSGSLGTNSNPSISVSSPVQVGALTNWSKIYARNFGFYAIKSDGTLWGWGTNFYGELGQNNTVYRSSPVQIGTLTDWTTASGGDGSGIFVKTNGTLWGVGRSVFGQLGTGDTISRSSPVQVGSQTNWSNATTAYATIALQAI